MRVGKQLATSISESNRISVGVFGVFAGCLSVIYFTVVVPVMNVAQSVATSDYCSLAIVSACIYVTSGLRKETFHLHLAIT